MTWLTVMGYLCQKWQRICRNHNLILSPSMPYHQVCNKGNMTGTTGAETSYPSGAPEFTPVSSDAQSLVFCVMFCRSLVVLVFFVFVFVCFLFWYTDTEWTYPYTYWNYPDGYLKYIDINYSYPTVITILTCISRVCWCWWVAVLMSSFVIIIMCKHFKRFHSIIQNIYISLYK